MKKIPANKSSKTHLATLSPERFNALYFLRAITFDFGKVSQILPGTFDKLQNLEFFSMKENNVQSLPDRLFPDSLPLKAIFLKMNSIKNFENQTFVGLELLETLDLRIGYIFIYRAQRWLFRGKSHPTKKIAIQGISNPVGFSPKILGSQSQKLPKSPNFVAKW